MEVASVCLVVSSPYSFHLTMVVVDHLMKEAAMNMILKALGKKPMKKMPHLR